MAMSKRVSITLDNETRAKAKELQKHHRQTTGETVSLASIVRQGIRKLFELEQKKTPGRRSAR